MNSLEWSGESGGVYKKVYTQAGAVPLVLAMTIYWIVFNNYSSKKGFINTGYTYFLSGNIIQWNWIVLIVHSDSVDE